MISSLLLQVLWKSFACAGITLMALAMLRRRSAAQRSVVAHFGLFASVLIAAAVPLAPQWEVQAPGWLLRPLPAETAPPPTQAPMLSPPAADVGAFDIEQLFAIGYGIPAAAFLLSLLIGIVHLCFIRRRARDLGHPDWSSSLAAAQQRAKLSRKAELLLSDDIASPLSWGLLRPIILIDRRTSEDPAEARMIIAHELCHVQRFDWVKLLLAKAAVALLWFNPLIWVLAKQCHELREEAVDDAVLSSDVAEADYAGLLLSLAGRRGKQGLLANAVAPRTGLTRRRILRILDAGLSRAPAGARWSLGCTLFGTSLAATLATMMPTAVQAERGLQQPSSSPVPETRAIMHAAAQKSTLQRGVVRPERGQSSFRRSPAVAVRDAEPADPHAGASDEPIKPALQERELQNARQNREALIKRHLELVERHEAALKVHEAKLLGSAASSIASRPSSQRPLLGASGAAGLHRGRGRIVPPSELPIFAVGNESIEVRPDGTVIFYEDPGG